jgi:hypothetical protein
MKRLTKSKRAPGEDTIDVEAFRARQAERLGGLGELVHAASSNSAWIVYRGKTVVGRVLAKGKADALELAAEFWGHDRMHAGKAFNVEQVKR